MKYTALWTRTAEKDLATIWMEAKDRGGVASAADTIDVLLREDPHLLGESRLGNVRIMFVSPLGIDFEVVPDDRTVLVITVWTIR